MISKQSETAPSTVRDEQIDMHFFPEKYCLPRLPSKHVARLGLLDLFCWHPTKQTEIMLETRSFFSEAEFLSEMKLLFETMVAIAGNIFSVRRL